MSSSQTLALVNAQPDPPVKPKGPKRRTQGEMPTSKSLSAKILPPSIYAIYDDRLIPTCYDIYGGFKDPWTIEPGPQKDPNEGRILGLADILTLLLKNISPNVDDHEKVEETDLVYCVVSLV